MIYDWYKSEPTRKNERNIQGISRASNVPPVTEIGDAIYDEDTATNVSIIKTSPESSVSTKSDNTSTNRYTTRVTTSTTSVSSQNIRYTRNLIFQSKRSKRSKR